MPKVSKESASQVRDFEDAEDRTEELDGYSVSFVSIRRIGVPPHVGSDGGPGPSPRRCRRRSGHCAGEREFGPGCGTQPV